MTTNKEMTGALKRISVAMLFLLLALSGMMGYWQLAQSNTLSARDDNPRLVLAEQQIQRGEILDRNGRVLANSRRTPGGYERVYPEPAAEPAVGYYSLRYGVGGAEAAFDAELRGTAHKTEWDLRVAQWLHRPQRGESVRLTLDLTAQRAAVASLGNRVGAAVVVAIPTGQILALASYPTFDPSQLDENWDQLRNDPASPLLNRATQGRYQPGAAFQSVILAEALSKGTLRLTETLPMIETPVLIGDTKLGCAVTPQGDTLAAAYAAGCPAPFTWLGSQFDTQAMTDIVRKWNLDTDINPFELPATMSTFGVLTDTGAVQDLALGQGALTLSPLQVAHLFATLANDGRSPAPPQLAFRPASVSPTLAMVTPQVARALREALVPQGDLYGQAALALSGQRQIAWFVGAAPFTAPRWVIVVLLENGDAATARQIAASIRTQLAL